MLPMRFEDDGGRRLPIELDEGLQAALLLVIIPFILTVSSYRVKDDAVLPIFQVLLSCLSIASLKHVLDCYVSDSFRFVIDPASYSQYPLRFCSNSSSSGSVLTNNELEMRQTDDSRVCRLYA
jgi:hypothetical protein